MRQLNQGLRNKIFTTFIFIEVKIHKFGGQESMLVPKLEWY
jgi:hypothetical protein